MIEILECGALAKEVLDTVKDGINKIVESGNGLSMSDTDTAIISINADEPSKIYMRRKLKDAEYVNVNAKHFDLTFDSNQDYGKEISRILNELTSITSSHTCYILQRPIPKEIEDHVLSHLRVLTNNEYSAIDVDALNEPAMVHIYRGDKEALRPCTAEAVYELIKRHLNGKFKGAEVLIIGRSNLVGKPLTLMLMNEGVSVTVVGSTVKSLDAHLKNKDIVVTAVGKAGLFNANQLSPNTFVIDVGITRLPNGKITGDMDHSFDESDMNIKYTPVPKGVGLLTTAFLFLNVYKVLKQMNSAASESYYE